MKHYILPLLFALIVSTNCRERTSDDSGRNLALFAIASTCPVPVDAPSIGGAKRTIYDFSNCNPTGPLGLNGFIGRNVTAGVTGSSAESQIISLGDFKSGTEKKVNLEVTFLLNDASGTLDVKGNANELGVGPGFRIDQTTIKAFSEENSTGTAFGTGTAPSTPVNTEKTYCLEIHAESSNAHIIGWSKSCLEVTNRGSYDFDQDVTSSNPGSKIAFVLNKATLKRVIVSEKIGTAGSLMTP
jgi:hypothetical protein